MKTAGGVGMWTLKRWNRKGRKRCRDGDTAEGMEQEGKGRDVGMVTLQKGWSRKGREEM